MLKTHFSINGYLTQMVYMAQPPVFTNPTHIQHMCVKFKKSLYGLSPKKKKKLSTVLNKPYDLGLTMHLSKCLIWHGLFFHI